MVGTDRRCALGCGRPHYARGWCAFHYNRWLRTGDPRGSERQILAESGQRRCPRCLVVRPHREFNRKLNGWQAACKRCQAADHHARYERDRDAQRAKSRRRHHEHREQILERQRRWRQRNPGAPAVYWRRRAARALGAAGEHTAEQLEARVAYFGGRCAYCWGTYEVVDHVKPAAAQRSPGRWARRAGFEPAPS